jgi:hypothetical protein
MRTIVQTECGVPFASEAGLVLGALVGWVSPRKRA